MRYIFTLSCVLGLVLGYFLPFEYFGNFLIQIREILLNASYIFVYPLLFFSTINIAYNIRRSKVLFSILFKTFIFLLIASTIAAVFGIILINILSIPKVFIPVSDVLEKIEIKGFLEVLISIFGKNPLKSMSLEYLFPILFFASLFGYFLAEDKNQNTILVQLLNSITKVFSEIASRFFFLISFVFGFVSAAFVCDLKANFQNTSDFFEILYFSALLTIFLIFVLYPLIFFIINRRNPVQFVILSLDSIIASFFSADPIFSLNLKFAKNSKDEYFTSDFSNYVYAINFMFSKVGTILLGIIVFSTIASTYLRIEIPFLGYLYIGLLSVISSLFLGLLGSRNSILYFAAFVTTIYAKGLENKYSVIIPISVIVSYLAAAIDVSTAILISSIISKKEFKTGL